MDRKKLSLNDLRVESFTTAEWTGDAAGTTLTDTGDTAPPQCNSIQTCVC